MMQLRCALFMEESQFGDQLMRFLSALKIETFSVTSLEALKALSDEHAFDFFIWTATEPQKKQSQVKALLQELPYLFSCLFSNKPVMEMDFDFTFTFAEFSSSEKLKRLILNLHHLAMRLKTNKELASLILHDLGTPLQNLASYVDMLSSGTFGELNEGQLKILKTINAQTDLAEELIQELSLLLRMRKNEFTLEKQKTNLTNLIQETLRAVWILADRKNIKLQSQVERGLPDLFVDSMAIRRVLFNLLINALKFSPQNGTVRLFATLESTRNGPQKIYVRITDSGPGIPPRYFDLIFDPYFRLENQSSKIKGHGLGLYIAKLFVEAHGGTIGVYNNREGGATFYFKLPVAHSQNG